MIILTKENILSYIKEHVPSLQLKEPVKVSMIGDGDLGEDVEGDGYCNYVFRVSDADGHSYHCKAVHRTIKTAWACPHSDSVTVSSTRLWNLGQRLFRSMFPLCILATRKTNVFIMEDVSNLKLIRFQMNKKSSFPGTGKTGRTISCCHTFLYFRILSSNRRIPQASRTFYERRTACCYGERHLPQYFRSRSVRSCLRSGI